MSDEELIERLRDWPYQGETMAGEAADRIEALVRSLENTQADFAEQLGKATAYELRMIDAEARAERLEAALREIESISVHSGGEVHGVTAPQWELAFAHAQDIASAALK